MLSRIAQELFWLGRNTARAEHMTRMLDGAFQASLQGETSGVQFGWGAILAAMGSDPGTDTEREDVLSRLTIDRNEPASVTACISRARESARTVRDVISAEMWEAINTTHLALSDPDMERRMQLGPYNFFQYVRERSALFWGLTSRTMLRDEARAFLIAGGRFESADMVLRKLLVTLPPTVEEDEGEGGTDRLLDGQAQALLHAVGGAQAFRRAVPSPPHAGPVARFLLYERGFPDSLAASIATVHDALLDADESPRESDPILRLSRLSADLEFRGRSDVVDRRTVGESCTLVQKELQLVDRDIALRYFLGSRAGSTVLA